MNQKLKKHKLSDFKNPDPINKNGYHYRKNFAINPLNPNQLLKNQLLFYYTQ